MRTNISSVDQLKRAITLAEQIEKLQAELNQILCNVGGKVATTASVAPKAAKTNKRSPEVRKRMAEAQKARWAKVNAAKTPATPAPAKIAAPAKAAPALKAKARKVISPAARAKMVAGIKARWAKIRAAKAASQKKATPAKVTPAVKMKIAAVGQPKFRVI